MDQKEAVRYFLTEKGRLVNAAARDRSHVLDGGRWVEAERAEMLSKTCGLTPLGSGELEAVMAAREKLKKFLGESGMTALSRSLLFNRDLEEILELLAWEVRELPRRTRMRGVYNRLWAQQQMFEGDIKDTEERKAAEKAGLKNGRALLHASTERGCARRLEAFCEEGKLLLVGIEAGDRPEAFHGRREYGYAYSLDGKNTRALHEKLKERGLGDRELLALVKGAFSGPEGLKGFKAACGRWDISYAYKSR